ncbi:Hypothetical predicted protein [Marmota monax]|uniref:Uncharacterized protein n=1 Tax=Marmota monax TaxID=9995 RepID=A0A5E4CKT1_MARMO|nr:Hypothetical predicted protein [Marmota monax]
MGPPLRSKHTKGAPRPSSGARAAKVKTQRATGHHRQTGGDTKPRKPAHCTLPPSKPTPRTKAPRHASRAVRGAQNPAIPHKDKDPRTPHTPKTYPER